jgi:hypothetical protein
MSEFEAPIQEKDLKTIADELDQLQQQENNGRGVSCVRSVVDYLKAGQLDEAKRMCEWDHDKIRNYPKLVEYLKNNLFTPEEHPWATYERLMNLNK